MKFVALLLALVAHVASGSVIGIDFSSEYMKVALVQLGVPLEIVTNTISKRKTEVVVAFDRGERLYGADAFGLLSRKPKTSFTKFAKMLGRKMDHPALASLSHYYFGAKPYYNETHGGLSFTLSDTESFTAQELTAMMFNYAKDITKAFGGKEVKDCVITVPSFYTAHERRAIMSAAKIANLKVLSLIEENTAAALQFGKDNVFENQTVLYYNMGSSSIQTSIVKYSSYSTKEMGKNKTVGFFDVLAKAWDLQLGGSDFDLRLLEHFAEKFNAVWKKGDVREHPRAMGKLRAQATKTKHVLSANSEIPVRINSLHDDVDLNLHITRKEFETMAADLLERVTEPITRVLEQAGLTLDEIDAVEMLGGAQRVPKIQETLSNFFGQKQLGVHLNADEAMALGAAFAAANISTAFKVRKTGMTDYTPFPVAISLRTLPQPSGLLSGILGGGSSAESDGWNKSTTVFKAWSKLDSKKTIAFVHDQDITCDVYYADRDTLPEGTPLEITNYNITGVVAAAKDMKPKGCEKPKVQLTFKLDSSGLVSISKAEATCEEPEAEKETASADNTTDAATEAADSDATAANATDATNATNATAAATLTKKAAKKKVIRSELKLQMDSVSPHVVANSDAEIETSRAKLAHLQLVDDQRREKEEAKNSLEAFIYEVRNKFDDDSEVIGKVTTEDQREEVQTLLAATAEWLDDEGYDVETALYREKRGAIDILSSPVFSRASELEDRPKAVKAARKRLSDITALLEKWKVTMPQVTEDEQADVLKLVHAAEKWIDDNMAKQDETPLSETPVFYAKNVNSQLQPVASLVTRLSRKPKPVKPKNATNATATNGTASTTEAPEATKEKEGKDAVKEEGEDSTSAAATDDEDAAAQGTAEEAKSGKDEL